MRVYGCIFFLPNGTNKYDRLSLLPQKAHFEHYMRIFDKLQGMNCNLQNLQGLALTHYEKNT